MKDTLIQKLQTHLPRAIKLFPGALDKQAENNRLETLKLLLFYLNKSLIDYTEDPINELKLQDLIDAVDVFISLFITLESHLLVDFLSVEMKSFCAVLSQCVTLFLELDRIYFTDFMVSLLSVFMGRMRSFGSDHLCLCDKIVKALFKAVSIVNIKSSDIARGAVLVRGLFLDFLPLTMITAKESNFGLLHFLDDPVSFLRTLLSAIFETPFFFPHVDEVCTFILDKASSQIDSVLLEYDQSLAHYRRELSFLSVFCQQVAALLRTGKQFSVSNFLAALPLSSLVEMPFVFQKCVLPLVLLCVTMPSNFSECDRFFRLVKNGKQKEACFSALLDISCKRAWSLELTMVDDLPLATLQRFAFHVISDCFDFDPEPFLISLLTDTDNFSLRLDISKCLALVSIKKGGKGFIHREIEGLSCYRDSESFPDFRQPFFEPLFLYMNSKHSFHEQEALGLWSYAITKHILHCKVLFNNPHSHHSISNCVSRLLSLCQRDTSLETLGAAFFIIWGTILGSGSIKDESILSLPNDSKLSFMTVPPCSTFILKSVSELLMVLRKCPHVELRLLLLNLCKLLIGNVQVHGILETDYDALSIIYRTIAGSDFLELKPYNSFDDIDSDPRILNLVKELLEYGHHVHYISFFPSLLNRPAENLTKPTLKESTIANVSSFPSKPLSSAASAPTNSRSFLSQKTKSVQTVGSSTRSEDRPNTSQISKPSQSLTSAPSDRRPKVSQTARSAQSLASTRSDARNAVPSFESASPEHDVSPSSENPILLLESSALRQESHGAHLFGTTDYQVGPLPFFSSSLHNMFEPLVFRSLVQNSTDATAELQKSDSFTSNHQILPPQTVDVEEEKSNKDSEMKYEELFEDGPNESRFIDDFLATNTVIIDDSEQVVNYSDLNSTDQLQPFVPIASAAEKGDSIFMGDSFIIQQSAQVKLPFLKTSVAKAVQQVVRHLVFSRDLEEFSYFEIYREGLLCGLLQFTSLKENDPVLSGKGVVALHPGIREIAMLDMHLVLELLQDFEMVRLTDEMSDEELLSSWISGLTDLHRHLLPLSRSFHAAEKDLKRHLSTAECFVITRDKISVIKLSTSNNLTESELDKIGSTSANLGAEQSRTMGSMILLEDSLTKWLSVVSTV